MSNEVSELNFRLASSITSVTKGGNSEALLERQKDLRLAVQEQGEKVSFCNHQVDALDVHALSLLLTEDEFASVDSLTLEDNELEDDALARLCEMLKINKNIVDLNLSDNKFTQKGVHYLLSALSTGKSRLQKLSLEDNTKIEGQGVAYLGQILETCGSLTTLNVSGIPLQSQLEAFVAGLKVNRVLSTLILENTRLDGEVMERFLDELCAPGTECRIEELNLNYNQCDSFTVYHPLFTHEVFGRLKRLHLSYSSEQEYSGYKKKPVKLILNYMKVNKSIRELYLKGNNFVNRDCHSLRSLLKLKSKLEVVDLSDNNIEMTGATLLCNCLTDNHTLQRLVLDGNRFLDEKGGKELYENVIERLEVNKRNFRGSVLTGKKSKANIRLHESNVSDGSFNGRKKSRFPSGGRKVEEKSDSGSGKKGLAGFEDNLEGDWESVVKPKSSSPGLGSNKFAANLEDEWDSVVHNKKSAVKTQFETNIDDEWESVVHNKASAVGSKENRFADNIEGEWQSVVKGGANVEDNLDNEWESVVRPKQSKFEDNLNNEWDSVVKPANGKAKKSIKHSNSDNLDDEDESVIYLDEDEDDFDSVVFDSEESPSSRPKLLQAKDSSRFFIKDESEGLSERSSNNAPDNWEYQEVTKSEMSYINHIREMYEKKSKKENAPVAIIDLKPESIEILHQMLSEFENLLDREENLGSVNVGKKVKRNFVKKFGIIGQLNKQKPGKVFDYTLAKSVIDRTLISRQLVRNISLINQFAKLRRQIGSGVPTKLGGMLPSLFFQNVVSSNTKMISISHLESFASSLLLIKVVVWSIFKAFTLSDPKVDPEGRKLLEEFGKAMIEKDNKTNGSPEYKKKSENYIAEKRGQLGKYIITGAVYELIDLLVLLRPMFAISEALYAAVASENLNPSLDQYDTLHKYRERRARKKLGKRYKRVQKLNKAMLKLGNLRKRATVERGDKQKYQLKKGEKNMHELLNGVELLQEKNRKKEHKRSSRVSKKSMQKMIEISPEILKYRENCPERVLNVLSDISVETKSLLTIISIENFFPTMLAFCDYNNTVNHYEKTAKAVLESMPTWVESLSQEFKANILGHVAPAVAPEVEKNMKPTRKFVPIAKISKSNSPNQANNELMNVFNRIKKKKKLSEPIDAMLKKPLKPEDESFFNPVLNNLFSWKKLTHGGSLKIRDVVKKKLDDKDSRQRAAFVKHVKLLCRNGCTKTIAMRALDIKHMHENEKLV